MNSPSRHQKCFLPGDDSSPCPLCSAPLQQSDCRCLLIYGTACAGSPSAGCELWRGASPASSGPSPCCGIPSPCGRVPLGSLEPFFRFSQVSGFSMMLPSERAANFSSPHPNLRQGRYVFAAGKVLSLRQKRPTTCRQRPV